MKINKEYKVPSVRIIELKPTEIIAGSPPYIPIPDDDPEMEDGDYAG